MASTSFSISVSTQPKGIVTVMRKKVIVAVVFIFSYKIREKEGCFCLGFYKERQTLKGARTRDCRHHALWGKIKAV